MKTVKKNVYYCEFCNKHGLSAGAMARHEKHCTMNPHRECRLCEGSPDIPAIIEGFKKRFKLVEDESIPGFVSIKVEWTGKEITLDEIHDLVEGCPNCSLAIMRQAKLLPYCQDISKDFHYQDELKLWWAEKNAEQDAISQYY